LILRGRSSASKFEQLLFNILKQLKSPGFMSNPGSVLKCRHQENQLHPNPPAAFHKSPVHAAFPDPKKMDQG